MRLHDLKMRHSLREDFGQGRMGGNNGLVAMTYMCIFWFQPTKLERWISSVIISRIYCMSLAGVAVSAVIYALGQNKPFE